MLTRLTAAVLSTVALAGCAGDAPAAPTTTASSVGSGPAPQRADATLRADATVLSRAGTHGSCGWGTTAGDTRAGVFWRMSVNGSAILLDEDLPNAPTDDIPFTGTIAGNQFTATYSNGSDYLKYACQFRSGTLVGTFTESPLTFEAVETLVWGPPESETRVERRWSLTQ